ELMVKAMKIRVGNPLRKLVLIKLADNASDQGECWPSYGRYSLNDLHRAAVASGANARTKEPGKFLSSQQTVELVHELTNTQNLGVDPVSVIHGGNERGTYVCKELVYAY
ncbi:KilA-N domain-containing protein, partial [Escherichia coli]|uniref:KilA-N domain-containing protein n=1 Tax=Escherichia coli TaxID=562 RepID=UPI0024821BA4